MVLTLVQELPSPLEDHGASHLMGDKQIVRNGNPEKPPDLHDTKPLIDQSLDIDEQNDRTVDMQ